MARTGLISDGKPQYDLQGSTGSHPTRGRPATPKGTMALGGQGSAEPSAANVGSSSELGLFDRPGLRVVGLKNYQTSNARQVPSGLRDECTRANQ